MLSLPAFRALNHVVLDLLKEKEKARNGQSAVVRSYIDGCERTASP
jgi:hypothetical protein